MARKKLNITVVIILAVLVLGFCGVGVLVFLKLHKNPHKLLAAAEVSLSQKNYEEAGKNLAEAYGAAKEDELKIEILFKLSEYHLINNIVDDKESPEYHESAWNKAVACWNAVSNIDTRHIKARRLLLGFFYETSLSLYNIRMDGGRSWENVEENASELLEILEEKGMDRDLYILKAKALATLQLAKLGLAPDRAEALNQAIGELEELVAATPDDIDLYKYLAEAAFVEGELSASEGDLYAIERAGEKAEDFLKKAIEASGDNVDAYVNLYEKRIDDAGSSRKIEEIEEVKDEIKELAVKFSSSADVYSQLARINSLRIENLDEAVEAITRSIELDPKNIKHILTASNLYYSKGLSQKKQQWIDDAITLLTNALELPDTQIAQGPQASMTRYYRHRVLSSLSALHIELAVQANENGDTEENQKWVSHAEQAIESIKQLTGTEENVYVSMWLGMLEMARGNEDEAVRKMFGSYEQLKTIGDGRDKGIDMMRLSYFLAKIFHDRPEIGVRQEFLRTAMGAGILQYAPELILEYTEVLIELLRWTQAIPLIDVYEATHPANDYSRSLRVKAYIGAGQFAKAEEELVKLDQNSVDAIELQLSLVQARFDRIRREIASKQAGPDGNAANVKSGIGSDSDADMARYLKHRNTLYEKLLDAAPDRASSPIEICSAYFGDGQAEKAKALADKYLSHFPKVVNVEAFRRALDEPDPKSVSNERFMEINEEILNAIEDEKDKALALGSFYTARDMAAEAEEQFEKVLTIDAENSTAITSLFDLMLTKEDFKRAQELIDIARRLNIDKSEGNTFAARLDIANGDLRGALRRLNEAIELRPIFPFLYIMRSNVHNALEDYDSAISDIKTARKQNPLSWQAVKQLSILYYTRNLRLGKNVTAQQSMEAETVLQAARYLNPRDPDVQSMYAQVIKERAPRMSLAIWQEVQQSNPTVKNSLLLGGVALQMSSTEEDEKYKEFLIDLAGSAYSKAYELDPESKRVVNSYTEYLRVTGKNDKVMELFGSQSDVLWQYYLRDGQYEKCKEVLLSLYKEDPTEVSVVRGLAVVAQQTDDTEGLKRYSEEFLAIDRTTQKELWQISTYLSSGLVQEAELKLASFRERHPTDPEGLLLDAWATMSKGQLKQALELVNRILAVDPEISGAWLLRGQINGGLGDVDQSVEDLQNAKRLSDTVETQMYLAQALNDSGRTTEAIGELVSVLQKEQAPERARRSLESLYIKTGRMSNLRKFYAQILEKYPDSDFWFNRVGSFYMKEKDYEQAEALLKKSWELGVIKKQENTFALDAYLEVLWKQGKYQNLLKIASKYVDGQHAPVAYAQMAQTYATMGNKTNAVTYYLKSIEHAGTNQEYILAILGNMNTIVGPGVVEKWCTSKLRKDPDLESANLTMFNVSLKKRQFNKAIEYIDKCINVVGKDNQRWSGYVIKKASTLTGLYGMTSNEEYLINAISTYKSILAAYPENLSVLNNLAYVLAENNEQLELALEYAGRAHKLSPNNPDLMDTYAYTLCKVQDYAKAEEMLQMAIQIFERNSVSISWDVYKHLATAQEGLGQSIEAADSYRRALKAGGNGISKTVREELNQSIERVLNETI